MPQTHPPSDPPPEQERPPQGWTQVEHPTGEQLDWFRQQPDYPVPPHRDADPVRTVWQLPRLRLGSRRFTGRLDHALVLVTKQGTYRTFMPPKRPTSVWGYVALYEVNTDPHAFQLNVPLPSRVDSFEFEATADITWRVVDPALFVESQERDVPALITRRLLRVMRAAGRGHPIEASAEAEKAVQRAVDAAPPLGAAEGVEVSCSVRLRRDAAERSHQDRLRSARYEAEAAEPEHKAASLREEYAAQRTAKKVRFYECQLARGGTAAVALHLAVHPEDTALVLDRLHTDQAQLVQAQLHLIDQALDNKRLEAYQLDEPYQLIADRMTAILRATGTPTGAEPPPPYPELSLDKHPDEGP
ncbi:SPFH domain-containing protein [Streptomyces sp. 7R007]